MKRNFALPFVCPGCNTSLRVELVTEPTTTGAMWTVDCPVCGMSKMIPDEPVKIYYLKEGRWLESAAHTSHFG
jgi:hypothetical protein